MRAFDLRLLVLEMSDAGVDVDAQNSQDRDICVDRLVGLEGLCSHRHHRILQEATPDHDDLGMWMFGKIHRGGRAVRDEGCAKFGIQLFRHLDRRRTAVDQNHLAVLQQAGSSTGYCADLGRNLRALPIPVVLVKRGHDQVRRRALA
ncbi:MAG: hypothetical protein U5O16_03245 [Rhodococcus sp. (in: high G+C Gram-positive bacteria)]|uniref:hypothetical protein n=1 Tax=Rhodococcus sp. TaxID=1831 RepID=UPI002AD61C8C|nr:hypothetical protein [Rhodococcus sp. (in: high G+C Gram-positive bacteria)]